MKLRIIQLLGTTSLQGKPQAGRRRFGVPPGGAFDQTALCCVNALCGNPQEAPALEIASTAFGESPFFSVECEEAGTLAIAGAECRVSINGRETLGQGRIALQRGDSLELRLGRRGMRVYLNASGGLTAEGRTLHGPDSRLPSARLEHMLESLEDGAFRYIPIGDAPPQRELKVMPNSDRIGLRLAGYDGEPRTQKLSEPSIMGAIQLTPSGELLIHGPDGPVTGGYPKIGVIVSADTARLGQLRPEQIVSLLPVTREEAVQMRSQSRRQIKDRTRLVIQRLAP